MTRATARATPDISERRPLQRTWFGTFVWFIWHPVSKVILAILLAVIFVMMALSSFGSTPSAKPTGSPSPSVGVSTPSAKPTSSAIAIGTTRAHSASPTNSARTTAKPPSKTPTAKRTPMPTHTVVITKSVVPPPPSSHSSTPTTSRTTTSGSGASYSLTVHCPSAATVTFNASGSGKVSTKVTGAARKSGSTRVVVYAGKAGTFYATTTDSGGHPSMSWSAAGSACQQE